MDQITWQQVKETAKLIDIFDLPEFVPQEWNSKIYFAVGFYFLN
jgi:hypothetical protein